MSSNVGVVAVPGQASGGAPAFDAWQYIDRFERWWGRIRIVRRIPPLLTMVLTVQAGLSLRLLWSNTAFTDEALYLWAGHLEWQHWLHGTPIAGQHLPTFFSGAPVIYPPLSALADSVGGLAGARLLSLAFMLGTTALLHATARLLYDNRTAICAAGLFAGLASAQFLGAFATYDAMALFLLALGTWSGVRGACATGASRGVPLLLICGLAMAIADMTKYASALFDPVVIGVAALAAWRDSGALRAIAAIAAPIGAAALVIPVALHAGGHDYITGLEATTLSRVSGDTAVPAILAASGQWVGAVAFLAVCGALTSACSGGLRDGLLGACLAVAVFLAPAEQARIHTLTSLFKHVGYGGWFGAIIGGYALASLVRAVPAAKARKASLLGTATITAAGLVGLTLAGEHFAGWPDSTSMMAQLTPVLNQVGCPCLITQNNPVNYYLHDTIRTDIIQDAFSFTLPDEKSNRELSGAPAYQAAIGAHYFRVLEVDPTLNPSIYQPVIRALATTPGYQRVGSSPSGVPGEPIQIWVLGGAE